MRRQNALRCTATGFLALAVIASIPTQSFADTKTWSATPANGNWNDGANWVGGVAPVNGDDLVFPAASTVKTTNNNIADLAVNSITFNGNGYTLNGNAITLAAAGMTTTTTGSNFIQLSVALTANSNFNIVNGSQITVFGVISGAFGFTKHTGTGVLMLEGANTFGGAIFINAGLVSVADPLALGAADGTPATGTTVAAGAGISLFAGQIIGNEWLSIAGNGAPGADLFGALYGENVDAWGGPIVLTADTRIGVGIGGGFTISNTISGPGSLEKMQGGTLILTGNSTYTSTTLVSVGTMLVNGSLSGTTGTSVASGATLGGTGTIASEVLAAAGSRIAPGFSQGILNTGSVTFVAGSTFTVELNGTTAGSGYDQLNVTGTVSLGGATLQVLEGFVPPPNAQFTIINNDGGDPVIGTFAGLAQGAQFNVGANTYAISYTGGTGNDVVLTTIASVPTMGPWFVLFLTLLLAAVVAWHLRRLPRAALP